MRLIEAVIVGITLLLFAAFVFVVEADAQPSDTCAVELTGHDVAQAAAVEAETYLNTLRAPAAAGKDLSGPTKVLEITKKNRAAAQEELDRCKQARE